MEFNLTFLDTSWSLHRSRKWSADSSSVPQSHMGDVDVPVL